MGVNGQFRLFEYVSGEVHRTHGTLNPRNHIIVGHHQQADERGVVVGVCSVGWNDFYFMSDRGT